MDAGSRDEAAGQEDGVCHLFEAMAFKSTRNMYVDTCDYAYWVSWGNSTPTQNQNSLMYLYKHNPITRRSHQQVVSALDDLGAIPTANASREQLLLSIDVLRNSVPEAMELFADTVLHPRFGACVRPRGLGVGLWRVVRVYVYTYTHPRFSLYAADEEEVEEAKVVLGLQLEGMAPELLVKEAIQEAAYAGQPLGRPHFVTAETLPG